MKGSEKKQREASTPFERFEDLTKRLLSVPKKEADTKAAERRQSKDKHR